MNTKASGAGTDDPKGGQTSTLQDGAAPPPGDDNQADAPKNTGLDNAIEALRKEFGDDVATLWRVGGPRKSRTDEVACVLAEVGNYPRRMIVQSFETGAFKLFIEVPGKTSEAQIEDLKGRFEGEGL